MMGTKNHPGDFDCYEKAHGDEPMFVLLARDPRAPCLVRAWAEAYTQDHGWDDKYTEAIRCANEMEAWQAAQPKDTPND